MGKFESFLEFLSHPAFIWQYKYIEEDEDDERETKQIVKQNELLKDENEKLKLIIKEIRRLGFKQKKVIDLK